MLSTAEILAPLARHRGDAVVITSMSVVRPWGRLSESELDFASADSAMGHTADLALGIALARPKRRVVCLNGDGSMLMSLGTLATIVEAEVSNLVLMVIDNRCYEITGNQPVAAADRLDFEAVARGVGFRDARTFDDAQAYAEALPGILSGAGTVFVSVRARPGAEGPIRRHPDEPAAYLQVSLAESARRLRAALSGSG